MSPTKHLSQWTSTKFEYRLEQVIGGEMVHASLIRVRWRSWSATATLTSISSRAAMNPGVAMYAAPVFQDQAYKSTRSAQVNRADRSSRRILKDEKGRIQAI